MLGGNNFMNRFSHLQKKSINTFGKTNAASGVCWGVCWEGMIVYVFAITLQYLSPQ